MVLLLVLQANRAAAMITLQETDTYFMAVLVTPTEKATNKLQSFGKRLDLVKEMIEKDEVAQAQTFEPDGFGVRDGKGHVVLVCYAKADGRAERAMAKACQVLDVAFQLNGKAATPTSRLKDALAEFKTKGFGAIRSSALMEDLGAKHGDVVSLAFSSEQTPPPSPFYLRVYDGWSWPGVAGFRIPVVAYGGVKTENGLDFSLLFPAVSWGYQANTSSPGFRHVGFGVLVAPSILETKFKSSEETQEGFTIKRLATGAYLDLGGYAWLGAGRRWDLTSNEDHRWMFFLVLGDATYKTLLGGGGSN